MPYFSATFSEVCPIPIRHFYEFSLEKASSESFAGSTCPIISNYDIDSTPPPIPISISPALIWLATEITA